MQISSKRTFRPIAAACVCVGLLAPLAAGPAYAFDPAKVFQGEKPSFKKIFKFFFSARKEGKEEDAVGALRYAAEQGSHAAQWKLGRMYQTGDGVKKDPAAAFVFYKQVADSYTEARPGTPDWQFTANAMVALGRYYRDGVPEAGIAPNLDEAQVMFTTAATYFNHPDAQFELAKMFLAGKDPRRGEVLQAARMLKSAVEAGHVGAEALLGHLLYEGEFLRRDPVRGLTMMMDASRRAAPSDQKWISTLQEEAFAVANKDERQAALTALKTQQTAEKQ